VREFIINYCNTRSAHFPGRGVADFLMGGFG